MSLDADAIVDRRRMRRKLTFWRVVALLIVVLAVGGAAIALTPGNWLLPSGDYIARIRIQGLIRDNQDRVEALERLGKSHAKAVIVHIDSPAAPPPAPNSFMTRCMPCRRRSRRWWWWTGSPPPAPISQHCAATTSSRMTHRWSARSACCSSFPTSPTRSRPSASRWNSIKSSPLKAAPNGFEPTSPEARAAIQAIILDSYAWFKGLVKDRRKMDDAQLAAVDDGRVFTGRQGVGLKLVDGLGNEKTALAWLAKEKKVPADTPVRDYALQPRFQRVFLPARRRLDLADDRPFGHCAAHRGVERRASSRAT